MGIYTDHWYALSILSQIVRIASFITKFKKKIEWKKAIGRLEIMSNVFPQSACVCFYSAYLAILAVIGLFLR